MPLPTDGGDVRRGRSQAYVEATLTREDDGEIVARATAVNLFLDPAGKK